MNSDGDRSSASNCHCRDKKNTFEKIIGDDRACLRCIEDKEEGGVLKPYKAEGKISCKGCPSVNQWFDPIQNDCVDIPLMQLLCNGNQWIVTPPRDSYVEKSVAFFPKFDLDDNYYLEIRDGQEHIRHQCGSTCREYTIPKGCGKPDGFVFARSASDSQPQEITLNTDGCTDDHGLTIIRKGVCQNCTACAEGQFNTDCRATVAGSTVGTCQACDPAKCSNGYQYAKHPLGMKGCDDPHAIDDYECADCDRVSLGNSTDGGYWIIQACGNNAYDRWDPTDTTGDTPKSIRCEPGVSNAACVAFDSGIETIQKRSKGTKLEYCPPGWFVDETCDSIAKKTDQWDPSCCQRCTIRELHPERKKDPDWRECTGYGTSDTQQLIDRCADNYYEAADETCVLCETCTLLSP